jgi:lysophospholipase L1-like esterase
MQMNIFLLLFIIFIIILLIIGACSIYIYKQSTKKPLNNPQNYLKRKKGPPERNRKILVLIGDSITQGRVGVNYVDMLSKQLPTADYELINAGINSELTWNVVERLDEIIACEPDYVTILIGTNDANANLSPKNLKMYTKRMKLPELPSPDWYRDMFSYLVNQLKENTDAQIALLSLPTIGESPQTAEFIQSVEYSKTIKTIANQANVAYLPLNEVMVSYLKEHPTVPKYPYKKSNIMMVKALIQHYLFKMDWNRIASNNGFCLHIDYLHLNNVGGKMIAEQIKDFIYRTT